MMHSRILIITSILIITFGVIEVRTDHTKLNVNVKESWLTTAEFANALSLSLYASRCTNVFIIGEFTINLS